MDESMISPLETGREGGMQVHQTDIARMLTPKGFVLMWLPLLLVQYLDTLISMADSLLMVRLGPAEITAVGLAGQPVFLFCILLLGINAGAGIFMAQYWGAKNAEGVHKAMTIAMRSGLVIGLLFALPALLMPERLMYVFSRDPQIIELGAGYLRLLAPTFLLLPFINTLNTALQQTGRSKWVVLSSVVYLLADVLLGAALIYGLFGAPALGVRGAAISAVCVRVVQLAVLLAAVFATKSPLRMHTKELFEMDWPFIKSYYKISGFLIFSTFLLGLGTTLYAVAYSFAGTQAQTAVQVASIMNGLFINIGFSVATAAGILMGNLLGAGKTALADRMAWRFLAVVTLVGLACGLVLILLAHRVDAAFNVPGNIMDSAARVMWVYGAAMGLRCFNTFLTGGILGNGGDTKFGFWVGFVSMYIVGLPLVFVGALVWKLPVEALVALTFIDDVVKAALAFWRARKKVWLRKFV